ncbi:uncharacterized protein LOC133842098 [Drosophila sulfurigaster albostrigata]|uniref:uncharacterized protein LOC133842098 n=1 Tax=Drosophila sulfurigaster albostrigata TaxID=89887 RepID=UPI002D21C460|nr:uncharacterized protein LOC133842098 [Drosophila sulfurigaster albostrigata]
MPEDGIKDENCNRGVSFSVQILKRVDQSKRIFSKMIAINATNYREFSTKSSQKSSSTGAVVNLKKLLKTVKRIFAHSKSEASSKTEVAAVSSCLTEEEFQNLLNEQIEAGHNALC